MMQRNLGVHLQEEDKKKKNKQLLHKFMMARLETCQLIILKGTWRGTHGANYLSKAILSTTCRASGLYLHGIRTHPRSSEHWEKLPKTELKVSYRCTNKWRDPVEEKHSPCRHVSVVRWGL